MNRRQFNKIAAGFVDQIALAAGPFGALIRRGRAGIQKRVLDADTKLSAEARADQVFPAYAVNGRDLAEKHGFPLRAVAEDHMGSVRDNRGRSKGESNRSDDGFSLLRVCFGDVGAVSWEWKVSSPQ